jgi:DNA-directed RNA polymerase sigma subunit (sigma70/sigma32)
MEVLGAAPSDLWTDQQLYMNLPRSSAWREVSEETLQAIADQHADAMALPSPDDLAEASEVKALVSDLLSSLSPREEKVMRLLYEEDKTLAEVAAVFELTIERIRQIRIKAEKKMRNPIRSNHLVRGMVIDGEITDYGHFGNYKEVPLISRAKRNAQ